jgi:hypothetical protein
MNDPWVWGLAFLLNRRPLLQHGVSMVAGLFRRGWFCELLLELARGDRRIGSERPSRQFPEQEP